MKNEKLIKYIDDYIKHIIDFSIYGNKFCKVILKYRDETVATIHDFLSKSGVLTTKVITNTVRQRVSKELDLLAEKITNHIIEQVEIIASSESEWIENELSEYLEVFIETKDIDKKKLLESPVAYAGVIGNFGESFVNKYRSFFFDIIAASYITGSTFEELKDSFQMRKNAIDRGVKAEAETLGSSLGSQYDRIVYTRNKSKITGYVWSAILDTSTCLICGQLDGKVFYDITKAPMYPIHPRCRCILIPFTKEIEEWLPESYSVWFERQSKADKKLILGKTRFQLYENGMKIKDFVNNGQITPLKSLKIKK